jgi:hypothetical protein
MRRYLAGSVRGGWFVLGVSTALGVLAVVLGLSGGADLVTVFAVAGLGLVFGVVGALVVAGSPGNRIGWIFCTLALLFQLSGLADAYIPYGDPSTGPLPGQAWVAWISQWFLNAASPALILLCFLLFPTGGLPSARWRPFVWVVAATTAAYAISAALAPGPMADYPFENPAGVRPLGILRTVAETSLQVLIVPLMFAAAASLFVRLRHASGIERQQLKWFAYAAVLLAAELVAANALSALLGDLGAASDVVFFLVFLAVLSGLPVAMGVAMLRHRLYDIDLLINRTLVYAALTASLALVYVGSVVSLQYVFRALAGSDSRLSVVVSTLAIAALFGPLRRSIQSFIDRRFYRRKYDARVTLETYAAKLRDASDLDRLGTDLVAAARETVQPEHASLWLRGSGNGVRP